MAFAPHGGLTGKERRVHHKDRLLRRMVDREIDEYVQETDDFGSMRVRAVPIRHRSEFLPTYPMELVSHGPPVDRQRVFAYGYQPACDRLPLAEVLPQMSGFASTAIEMPKPDPAVPPGTQSELPLHDPPQPPHATVDAVGQQPHTEADDGAEPTGARVIRLPRTARNGSTDLRIRATAVATGDGFTLRGLATGAALGGAVAVIIIVVLNLFSLFAR